MAHFAKLDASNTVVDVVVVNNADAPNEETGIVFLTALLGAGNWEQCSYNGNMRKQYPGLGYFYDPDANVFIAPQPFPSWALDANHDWQPPTPQPGPLFKWNETTLAWGLE
jgi:hypothetical protein